MFYFTLLKLLDVYKWILVILLFLAIDTCCVKGWEIAHQIFTCKEDKFTTFIMFISRVVCLGLCCSVLCCCFFVLYLFISHSLCRFLIFFVFYKHFFATIHLYRVHFPCCWACIFLLFLVVLLLSTCSFLSLLFEFLIF